MYSYFLGGFDFFDFCLLQDVRSGFDLFLLCLLVKIDCSVVVIAWQLLKEAVGLCDVIYDHSRLFYIVQLAFLSATLCFQFWILKHSND